MPLRFCLSFNNNKIVILNVVKNPFPPQCKNRPYSKGGFAF